MDFAVCLEDMEVNGIQRRLGTFLYCLHIYARKRFLYYSKARLAFFVLLDTDGFGMLCLERFHIRKRLSSDAFAGRISMWEARV